MSDYDKLDQLIIESIGRDGPMRCSRVWAEALLIARETGRDQMRVVDGRLTALKKAGRIRYVKASNGGSGWEVTK